MVKGWDGDPQHMLKPKNLNSERSTIDELGKMLSTALHRLLMLLFPEQLRRLHRGPSMELSFFGDPN